ncbi:P-loop containing nucleoside triphosphate hydrolase protein [Lophiostoma macrostomum CBS 122681]|uniref:P-loop containing nucleoside triphosphate hydrolase protein n=1 Tax=Lophiostoma macrostomum CBS 122681 TaxID=1314788 RepID=A0A6A6TT56_9PLEO|nr:P-loop containing nucleoside triphosphate hydrolase protein [Lophiostoma macrostomum CBS 122681]
MDASNLAFPAGTTIWPGLAPYATIGRARYPDPSQATLMDLASSAIGPIGMVPGLIPLYKIVHGLVLKKHRYDITDVATKTILALGAVAGVRLLWNYVSPQVVDTVTCSYTVPLQSKLGACLEAWIGEHARGVVRRHRKLISSADGKQKDDSQQKDRYSTRLQSGWLWFEGHIFFFEYGTTQVSQETSPVAWGGPPRNSQPAPERSISVYAIHWFSAHALGRFISELTNPKHDDQIRYTEIHTLISGRNRWHTTKKPARSLATIDLDDRTKEMLVKDVETYVDPNRQQWYANRGIPYRRGYLFHGPPGTGKTSTSTALAGKLNSRLYIASLGALKDDRALKFVFGCLAKGDVLLLEDIDSAGIVRENMRDNKKKDSTGIKLAELLNAIDGAASVEGIVLIMTTNEPENLDPALVRPGRIDRQVYFGEINRFVARSIFLRMYQDEKAPGNDEEVINHQLHSLATAFAAKIPENKVTPAEVQTFLTFYADAQEAVDRVDQWIRDTLAAKAANRIISGEVSKEAEPFEVSVGEGGTFEYNSEVSDTDDENGETDEVRLRNYDSGLPDDYTPLGSEYGYGSGPETLSRTSSDRSSDRLSTCSSTSDESGPPGLGSEIDSVEACVLQHDTDIDQRMDICRWCKFYEGRIFHAVFLGPPCEGCGYRKGT